MNLIDSFWRDHAAKHVISHKSCLTEIGLDQVDTIAEKDKAYADCHNNWIKDFKNNQSNELEARARMMFGKTLDA